MARTLIRTLVLFVLWILLSGHFDGLLLSLGIASSLLVALLAGRIDAADREPQRMAVGPALITYWAWLAWQVILSNIDVARRVLSPSLPISPCIVRVRASQKTDLGRVIFANSITLTPGTVSIDLQGDEVEVHALSREAAEDLQSGAMDRRASAAEPTQ
ncbi:Na+/H+ antiporter subunit E [Thiohalorhabdus methylotrophus]|uniref:Na+/H+ antiporter subunit E n=1 Tax=Thiohalorhabdus methylotrophus TaxID=3242694 RepID=A0ABV4TT72_9GAMM